MPDLKVLWYRFAADRIWKHNRRAIAWGEHASELWYGMTPAQRRKAARACSPF